MYTIEIEIFEGKGGQLRREGDTIIYPDLEREGICAWMYRGDGEQSYQAGQRFTYPADIGKLCPWLLDSMHGVIHVLRFGGTLGWMYEDTPYEKGIDPEGVTTEYVRCIESNRIRHRREGDKESHNLTLRLWVSVASRVAGVPPSSRQTAVVINSLERAQLG